MLDLNKPFGRVRGVPGVAYEQGNTLYSAQKEPVDVTGKPLTPSTAKPTPKAKAKPTPKAPPAPTGVRPMSEQVEGSE